MKAALILMPAALVMTGNAQAQGASAQQTPPTAAAPAQPNQQGATDVSDQEVERFALAALLVQQIAQDSAVSQEQKQAAMANALNQTGVAPERFNEIARASQSDPELTQRIEVAAANHVQAAQQQNQ